MTPPAPVPPRVPGPPRAPVVPSVPAVPAPVPGGRAARGFTVDPWDPSYGLAVRDEPDGGLGESSAQLDLDLELAAGRWRPVDPDPTTSLPGSLLFLDGVRRVDARIWLHGGGPEPAPGIAASFAAGLVCCNSVARIEAVTVHRGLFTAAAGPPPRQVPGAARGRRRARPVVARAAAGPRRRRSAARGDVPRQPSGRRRRARGRRTASRPKPPGAHRGLHQDPPRVLPAGRAGHRGGLARARAAHPGVRHGHLVAPHLLVPAPSRC